MALPRLESFAAAAGVLDGTWTQQRTAGTVNYDGAGAAQASVPDVDAFAFDNSNVYPNDQYAKLTIAGGLSAGLDYVGVLTRASLTGDANYKNYCFYTDGTSGAGHTAFGVITADVLTELTSFATTFTGGDVMELRSTGPLHECFKNGVSLGTFTDATHTAGSAGLEVHNSSGGGTPTVSDWEGGAIMAPITTGSTGTRKVGNARGPYDRRGFVKRAVWDFTVIAAVAGAITGTGSMETNTSFAYSGTSTQAESGTGSLAIASPAYSGSVTQTVTGTGSLAIATPQYSGTGGQGVPGSGSLAIASPQYSGTGTQAGTGTGSLAIAKPAYSGTVGQAETGTGSLAIGSPAFSGTVVQTTTGSGSLAVGSPALSGTSGQQSSGTGTLAIAVSMSGTATNGNTITGTGSLAVAKPAYSGTVVQSESGSGTLAIAPPSLSGAGSQAVAGTGSLAVGTPSHSGSGIAGNIGSGVLAIPVPSYSGTGTNTPPAVVQASGKYRPEHDSALVDVAGATGFAKEHTDALADVGNATGFSNEHMSALKDVGDAGV